MNAIQAFETPKKGESHPIARAMFMGKALHIPYVDEAFIQLSITPKQRQEAWRTVDIRSLVCAPLITSSQDLGALTLLRTGKSVPFEMQDVNVIEEVARQAAVTIENIRLKKREQQSARNIQAFADIGKALAECLGVRQTLNAVMRAIVPKHADLAFINLLDEDGDLRPFAVHYHDQSMKQELSFAHADHMHTGSDDWESARKVIQTRLPLFVRNTTHWTFETIGDIGPASMAIIPLITGSSVRGTLHLYMENKAHLDIDFLQELAHRIASAVANAEVFERERRVAQSFQEAALPSSLPTVPGFVFHAIYEAGKTEATVGGDWYDAFSLVDGRIVVSIGDVAGSGLSAAVTMANVRQAIRAAAHVRADPAVMLTAAEHAVLEDPEQRFVTAFVGVIDPAPGSARITYQSAGHPPPILWKPTGKLSKLQNQGPPLSLRMGRKQRNKICTLPSGSLLILFTDGLIESTHDVLEGERSVWEALLNPSLHAAKNPAKILHDTVLIEGSRDDTAILMVKIL